MNKIIVAISALLPDAYPFGSRARGTNGPVADIDIDIDIDAGKRLPIADVDEVKSMFKESNIMYMIDGCSGSDTCGD